MLFRNSPEYRSATPTEIAQHGQNADLPKSHSKEEASDSLATKPLHGPGRTSFVTGLYADVVEILHARPTHVMPIGIVLCFHGCTHSGSDWFTLPEEGIIVRESLKNRLAILAVTSYDRRSGCWGEVDLERIQAALQDFHEREQWSKGLPLFSLGASSGGSFASSIQSRIPVVGIYIQIGRPSLELSSQWKSPFPIALHMLYMSRDAKLDQAYSYYANQLKAQNKDILFVKHLMADRCRITSERLADRIYDMDRILADQIIAEMLKRLIIDDDGFPLESTLYSLTSTLPSDEMFYAIQEEVKCCYAKHELTSEFFADVVLSKWLSLI